MKKRFLGFLIAIAVINFSCEKDEPPVPEPEPDPQPTYQISGLWIGTYTVDQMPALDPLPYYFTIKPNGTILTEAKGADGTTYYHQGTWGLVDSTFTAIYTTINRPGGAVTQSATMTFHTNGTFTNATWTDVINPGGHLDGKFQNVKRVN